MARGAIVPRSKDRMSCHVAGQPIKRTCNRNRCFQKAKGEPVFFFKHETITKVKHVRDHVAQCSKQANDMQCMCVV